MNVSPPAFAKPGSFVFPVGRSLPPAGKGSVGTLNTNIQNMKTASLKLKERRSDKTKKLDTGKGESQSHP